MYRTIGLFVIVALATTLSSCDAMLHMFYVVKNKSDREIPLVVHEFPKNPAHIPFSERTDTLIYLQRGEELIVDASSKLDFPWATKNIYRDQPGICGIERLDRDTTIEIGCSKKEWKYRRGWSVLKLK